MLDTIKSILSLLPKAVSEISDMLFGDVDFMRFENPFYLWLTFPVLILFVVSFIFRKRMKAQLYKLFTKNNVNKVIPGLSDNNFIIKSIIWFTALLFIIVAAANLQFGAEKRKVDQEGIDLIFALDVSKSMLAEDIKPNRLERAKYAMQQIVNDLVSDRLGIVVFAGDAYLQLPLTSDHSATKMYLNNITTDIIPVQGTSLSLALQKSYEAFPENQSGNRAIILISDGENHDEEAIELAKKAKKHNVQIYCVGIGSKEGVMIPEIVNRRKVGWKKDKQGSTVVTRLNEQVLIEIASEGDGEYVMATTQSMGLETLMDQIRSIERTKMGVSEYQSYDSFYYVFLIFGILLLITEQLLIGKKWEK